MTSTLTTIQISKDASDKLKALADSYKRSKASQAEWLIEQEYQKLAEVKLVGQVKKTAKAETLGEKGGVQ